MAFINRKQRMVQKKQSQTKSKKSPKKDYAKSAKAKAIKTPSRKTKSKKLSPWLLLLLLIPVALTFFLINNYQNKRLSRVSNQVTIEQGTDVFPAEISVSEAYTMYTNGAFMLDVREPHEWRDGHIPGATLIPLEELVFAYQTLPDLEPIVVVCRSGNRSAQARDFLKTVGFTQVTSMAGGMNDWKAAGFDWVMGD
jgi:rhodanese-related sulfurtransferase